uniref:Uncharacterized protein n=1 Tax=Octopus bimaculoides TaxID=37653 RepID=A0A0L8FMT3_OCTBM
MCNINWHKKKSRSGQRKQLNIRRISSHVQRGDFVGMIPAVKKYFVQIMESTCSRRPMKA